MFELMEVNLDEELDDRMVCDERDVWRAISPPRRKLSITFRADERACAMFSEGIATLIRMLRDYRDPEPYTFRLPLPGPKGGE